MEQFIDDWWKFYNEGDLFGRCLGHLCVVEIQLEESTVYRLQASNSAATVVFAVEIKLAPPRLESVRMTNNGSVRIKVAGSETLDIEHSTDLVNWEILAENVRESLEVFRFRPDQMVFYRGVRRGEPQN